MELLRKIRRGLRKPPKIIMNRVIQESRVHLERMLLPWRVKCFKISHLAKHLKAKNLDDLWQQLAKSPGLTGLANLDLDKIQAIDPDFLTKLQPQIDAAMNNQVELFGSGQVSLGESIDWHQDYKTGIRWQPAYFRNIEYCNPELPSDVKFPWELSRMQWLIPLAQAFHLTKNEAYAKKVKNILNDWIENNPVGRSVNWSCTMEVAMRIFTWTWFFHVFSQSEAWNDASFRSTFLINLYWHGIFTDQFIEESDINGNHYTADAAALVVAGSFWGKCNTTKKWLKKGWVGLNREIDKQVYSDGVNFEASTAYHRLVTELFFIAAKARLAQGLEVKPHYLEHLRRMAMYVQAYSRVDGSIPLCGDADDARTLPFGLQAINDHRYLPCLIGLLLKDRHLLKFEPGDCHELIWWYGSDCFTLLNQVKNTDSKAFAFNEGGFYIMRHQWDHIFIDCGRVGLADRGGHGHNDCLSFSAVLQGCDLVTDRGACCYTSSYEKRNTFRATASHNTPQIDDEEINRFVYPHYLWNFHYDAKPSLIMWEQLPDKWIFSGTHSGYARLTTPVTPVRTISYFPSQSKLEIYDVIQSQGVHQVKIPLHLSPGVKIEKNQNKYSMYQNGKIFQLTWQSDQVWNVEEHLTTISPTYGVEVPSLTLCWIFDGQLPVNLRVSIEPK